MREDRPDRQIHDVFGQLAEQIYAGDEPSDIHHALTKAAVDYVEGCDHASIMIAANKRYITIAASDDIAMLADSLERQLEEGPCVDAIEEEAVQVNSDIASGSEWPKLAEELLKQTPIRGMMGFRLLVDNRKIGALNLFSDTPGVFTAKVADEAAVIAAFASIAMMTLSARHQSETMARGLDSNREIGKAIGLLMAAHKFSEDEAFELLRTTSQNLNIKIQQVARKVIDGQQEQYARVKDSSG